MIVLLLAAALLPRPDLTPGAVMTTSSAEVCERGYAGRVRKVSTATKRAVLKAYGIRCTTACGKHYEIDHLISLELGGSNEPSNLWPQPYEPPAPGAHAKDLLENYLHHQVCAGEMTLEDAQRAIARDWLSAWKAMPKKGPAYRKAASRR